MGRIEAADYRFSTIVLLIYMETFGQMAGIAADLSVGLGLVRNPSPIVHATLALVVLFVATVLALYKPLGMTVYGRRKQCREHQRSRTLSAEQETQPREALMTDRPAFVLGNDPADVTSARGSTSRPRWIYVLWIVAIGALTLFVVQHFMSGGAGRL